jgi:hypothetical protein
MVTFWATFGCRFFFHFYLNKQFQNMVCHRDFKVSKVVQCKWFKLRFVVDILAFLELADFWGLLFEKLNKFFSIVVVLPRNHECCELFNGDFCGKSRQCK